MALCSNAGVVRACNSWSILAGTSSFDGLCFGSRSVGFSAWRSFNRCEVSRLDIFLELSEKERDLGMVAFSACFSWILLLLSCLTGIFKIKEEQRVATPTFFFVTFFCQTLWIRGGLVVHKAIVAYLSNRCSESFGDGSEAAIHFLDCIRFKKTTRNTWFHRIFRCHQRRRHGRPAVSVIVDDDFEAFKRNINKRSERENLHCLFFSLQVASAKCWPDWYRLKLEIFGGHCTP